MFVFLLQAEELAELASRAASAEDPVMVARREAETHMIDPFSYTGQGACELDRVNVKLPEEIEPYEAFSTISLSNIDDMRATVEATGGQLEPFDIDAAMKAHE